MKMPDYYNGNFPVGSLDWNIQQDIRQRDRNRENESDEERIARWKREDNQHSNLKSVREDKRYDTK